MPARLTRAEREEKKGQVWALSLRGHQAPAIAHMMKLHPNTVRSLIKEAGAEAAKERIARGISDLDRYLAEQDSVIAECWKRLASTKDQSLNASAILGIISVAQERKAKALGLLKDKGDGITIDLGAELRERMKTPVTVHSASLYDDPDT